MKKYIKLSLTYSVSITTFIFMFLPENLFKNVKLLNNVIDEVNIIVNRILFFVMVLILILFILGVHFVTRNSVKIRGRNYTVEIKYGDIFKQKKCKKLIPFDECFTTSVGTAPADINPSSVCGKYLKMNPNLDIDALISASDLKTKGKSKNMGRNRYESGRLIINGDYLLMAFVKLDKDGVGRMTYSEFLVSLSVLWEEIDKYYGQEDVCIPILGSGATRLRDISLTKQEVLDIIIASYKLAQSKIHKPNKLVIVCRKEDVSLNKIGTYI